MEKPPHSEEIIIEKAWTTVKNVRPLLAELDVFGINEAMVNEFEKEIEAAEATPREIENRVNLKSETHDTNVVLKSCFDWCNYVKTRIEMAFGETSPEAYSFPSKELREGKNKVIAMLGIFNTILVLAQKYQDQITRFGWKTESLAQGKELYEQLREANENLEHKKDQKKMATKARHQQFIAIYKTVNKINRAGRMVFKDDPVKSVLFQSPWPKKKSDANDEDDTEGKNKGENSGKNKNKDAGQNDTGNGNARENTKSNGKSNGNDKGKETPPEETKTSPDTNGNSE